MQRRDFVRGPPRTRTRLCLFADRAKDGSGCLVLFVVKRRAGGERQGVEVDQYEPRTHYREGGLRVGPPSHAFASATSGS